MQQGENGPVEAEGKESSNVKKLPEHMFYNYEELYSRPVITADSEIPENLLHLSYPLLEHFPSLYHLARDFKSTHILPSSTDTHV